MPTRVKAVLKWVLLIGAYVALGFAILAGLAALTIGDAWSHPVDGKKNAAGEFCCGEGDCFSIPSERVTFSKGHYIIWPVLASGSDLFAAIETVPEIEAQPSPDGSYWRCKRPDGSRRCFFAPSMGY